MRIQEVLEMAVVVDSMDMNRVRILPMLLHFEPARRPMKVQELDMKTGLVYGPDMLFWQPATAFQPVARQG